MIIRDTPVLNYGAKHISYFENAALDVSGDLQIQ